MSNKEIKFNLSDVGPLWLSTIGLEREGLRVNKAGEIAETDHPKDWGNRLFHPYLQTDFAESQLELITPPVVNPEEIVCWLSALHQISQSTLVTREELMWPYSFPPLVTNLATIKSAQLENKHEFRYREYLTNKYGKNVQLINGIHYNFQINPDLIKKKINSQNSNPVIASNTLYFDLMRKYLYYRWVLTFFLGASPFASDEYSTKMFGKPAHTPMRSIRQSRYGYQNSSDVKVTYKDFASYVDSVEENVRSGKLSLEKELYRDVRLRGQKSYRGLLEEGTKYIELRNFDLNPWARLGMTLSDIYFIKVWLIALIIHDQTITNEEVLASDLRQLESAESSPLDALLYPELFDNFKETLIQVANQLDKEVQVEVSFSTIVSDKLEVLNEPAETLSGQIIGAHKDFSSLSSSLISLAAKQQDDTMKAPYQLHGFEHLELSTQDVIKEALKMGIRVSIVDQKDQLIQLDFNRHTEFLKNANMTSKDSLISYFLMDNKVATKEILNRHQLNTPGGLVFDSSRKALAAYDIFKQEAIVIKPKNTNYGLGITLFDRGVTFNDYQQAIEEAFHHDRTILIEQFFQGPEIRFYVQNGKVLAACERQSAHIIGDGHSNVRELVKIENKNPLRGIQHVAPLTKLEMGPLENLTLKEQNLTFDSVPKKNQKVYLRRNSNVSSGGIAIDRTNDIHPDYIHVAEAAAKALDTFICGVDIIIKNPHSPINNQDDYAILEANYNPMMSLHLFPAVGKAQPLSRSLLEALFPEYPLNN